MRHSYLDKYADLDSFVHRLDPRMKIIALVIFVVSIVSTKPTAFISIGIYGTIVIILIMMSNLPLRFVLKRSLVIIPFVVIIAIFIPFFKSGHVIGEYSFGSLRLSITHQGLLALWNILIKSYLSVLFMILLLNSTKYHDLLKALDRLRCPKLIVMILSFMYRYIFVLEDELDKMKQAKASRTVGGSRWFHIKTLANILGSLFIKSYERGEAVYLAMCARGFEGEIRTMSELRLRTWDFVFLFVTVMVLIGTRLLSTL
jgi:cobalt/nickel transport system permease protein